MGEIGLATADDAAIMDRAVLEQAVIVTLDSDFHMLIALRKASAPSVIRIRLERLGAAAAAALVTDVVRQYTAELQHGCMLTVKDNKITCRLLPRPG